MTIHSLHIFDRHCNIVFYCKWNAKDVPGGSLYGDLNDKQLQEDAKLVYGVVFSLRNIISKLSPDKRGEPFLCFKTNQYKLHYMETANSLKFVLLTDPTNENGRAILSHIYASIYVEYVSKNAMIPFDTPFNNDLFRSNLQKYIRGLPGFQ
ncbi:Trafficking protein particle complex subunit 1 [Boothiomyces sp. JEL0866]|nr:Trafficking protein particle complex subunit 1 [Boothiomyces sp. JEL0866]